MSYKFALDATYTSAHVLSEATSETSELSIESPSLKILQYPVHREDFYPTNEDGVPDAGDWTDIDDSLRPMCVTLGLLSMQTMLTHLVVSDIGLLFVIVSKTAVSLCSISSSTHPPRAGHK